MGAGWGAFFGGIGTLLEKLPFQGRKERWKNKLEALAKERASILSKPATRERVKRVMEIDEETKKLQQYMKNSNND